MPNSIRSIEYEYERFQITITEDDDPPRSRTRETPKQNMEVATLQVSLMQLSVDFVAVFLQFCSMKWSMSSLEEPSAALLRFEEFVRSPVHPANVSQLFESMNQLTSLLTG
jgi:hypothetical protein